jgi:lipopolysaccharide transport system ATP-binding protein
MSSDAVITVENLEKSYRLYSRPFDRVREAFSLSRHSFHTDFQALSGISFEIKKGETVGLIGPNGSGKSTLLEILCGTLTPTRGTVKVKGKIGGLLELGAGFNPEFTGRENVYLNGSIFGFSREAIDGKIDDIEAFADIGDFVDRPVKTYSSGMYVRLAFAAMIGLDPDILVVDEALAVGDVRFQRKCYRHFQALQSTGTTILFVSHAVDLIRTHCSRAIQLEGGQIVSIGSPKAVVQGYLESLFLRRIKSATVGHDPNITSSDAQKTKSDPDTVQRSYNPDEHRWGDGRAKIINYSITSDEVEEPVIYARGASVEIRMQIHFFESLRSPIYGLTIRTLDGVTVFGANTRSRYLVVKTPSAGDETEIVFKFQLNVLAGDYFISLGVADDDEQADQIAVDRRYDVLHLIVKGGPDDLGFADMEMSISESA